MALTVSIVNMKGGVGKTTLVSQVAHKACQVGLKVLAVDLDPQGNLSQSLLGPKRYSALLEDDKPTVVQIFEGYRPTTRSRTSTKPISIRDVIIPDIGFWKRGSLDLIPSRLEFSRVLKHPSGSERNLAAALAGVVDDYDLTLIDCAPTESLLTDAAYYASRYIVVPVKPEFLASVGLPLLHRSVDEFSRKNRDHKIAVHSVVFNHSTYGKPGPEARKSMKEVHSIAATYKWPVFPVHMRYTKTLTSAARTGTPVSRTAHVKRDTAAAFDFFCKQFLKFLGFEDK
ncbi:MAG: ParA family protein [Planctomycetaceae bacterium]|nr:ParA family protein [Planctomycetaceae bacterium]